MHYYKRNLGDYAKKCGRLTMLQHGAYTLLIDACYDREVFPTLEQAIEWTWASTEQEIEAVKFVLSRFFKLSEDGTYVQDRILSELLEYHAKADKNKRIAIERETKRKQGGTNRSPDVDEPPPNHKPITNNQEDISSGSTTIPTISSESDQPKLKSVSKTIPDCPHADILALWLEKLPTAIQPADWNEKRQQALRSRWREKGNRQKLEWWARFFEYIGQSDFLMGRTNTPGRKAFALSLDWLCKSENFLKVIEGRFHEQEAVAV